MESEFRPNSTLRGETHGAPNTSTRRNPPRRNHRTNNNNSNAKSQPKQRRKRQEVARSDTNPPNRVLTPPSLYP